METGDKLSNKESIRIKKIHSFICLSSFKMTSCSFMLLSLFLICALLFVTSQTRSLFVLLHKDPKDNV